MGGDSRIALASGQTGLARLSVRAMSALARILAFVVLLVVVDPTPNAFGIPAPGRGSTVGVPGSRAVEIPDDFSPPRVSKPASETQALSAPLADAPMIARLPLRLEATTGGSAAARSSRVPVELSLSRPLRC
jgi:hypothetical protein